MIDESLLGWLDLLGLVNRGLDRLGAGLLAIDAVVTDLRSAFAVFKRAFDASSERIFI